MLTEESLEKHKGRRLFTGLLCFNEHPFLFLTRLLLFSVCPFVSFLTSHSNSVLNFNFNLIYYNIRTNTRTCEHACDPTYPAPSMSLKNPPLHTEREREIWAEKKTYMEIHLWFKPALVYYPLSLFHSHYSYWFKYSGCVYV